MTFSTQKNSPKVVVIGAGIAGLTTAYRLQQQGTDVELYEARSRVGGRILSIYVNDQIGELGAQGIYDGGVSENLCRLIDEFGLEIQSDTIITNAAYFTGDKLIEKNELFPQFDPDVLRKKLSVARKKSKTMHDVLSTFFDVNDPAFKYISVRLSAYEGAPVEKLSSYYTETLYHMMLGRISAAYQENNHKVTRSIKGGNSLLPENLLAALKNRVHFNSCLTSVSKLSDGSYKLIFQNGQMVNTDILVLAVPSSVYTDINFEENIIPHKRLTAIKSIQYGTNAKILIPFQNKPKQGIGLINDRMGTYFNANQNLLTCYYTGESSKFSQDTINDTLKKDQSMLELGYSYSNLSQPVIAQDEPFIHYDNLVGYSWPNDPYVKGSYSYISPGQEDLLTKTTKYEEETTKTLFSPINENLYFAGEHTSILQDVPGTLEAACESGERTARMITKKLK